MTVTVVTTATNDNETSPHSSVGSTNATITTQRKDAAVSLQGKGYFCITVNIIAARDLRPTNYFSKELSDSFAKVSLLGTDESFETDVVFKSNSPQWNASHNFVVQENECPNASVLNCTLYGRHLLFKNTFIGRVEIPLSIIIPDLASENYQASYETSSLQKWFKLLPNYGRTNFAETTGFVHISLTSTYVPCVVRPPTVVVVGEVARPLECEDSRSDEESSSEIVDSPPHLDQDSPLPRPIDQVTLHRELQQNAQFIALQHTAVGTEQFGQEQQIQPSYPLLPESQQSNDAQIVVKSGYLCPTCRFQGNYEELENHYKVGCFQVNQLAPPPPPPGYHANPYTRSIAVVPAYEQHQ